MTARDRYMDAIRKIDPARWWTLDRYRAEIDAVCPPEAKTEWNAGNIWADCVRAAVADFAKFSAGFKPAETGDLFGVNHD